MTSLYPDRPPESGLRLEHDSMGDMQVPSSALYAAQTQRAVENFPVSGYRVDPAVLAALARIKAAAARTNAALGMLDAGVAQAVSAAADDLARTWTPAGCWTSSRWTSSRPARAPQRT
jgi:fumarate hydratase class II